MDMIETLFANETALDDFEPGTQEYEVAEQLIYSFEVIRDIVEIYNSNARLVQKQTDLNGSIDSNIVDEIDKLSLALSDIEDQLNL